MSLWDRPPREADAVTFIVRRRRVLTIRRWSFTCARAVSHTHTPSPHPREHTCTQQVPYYVLERQRGRGTTVNTSARGGGALTTGSAVGVTPISSYRRCRPVRLRIGVPEWEGKRTLLSQVCTYYR